MRRRTVIFETRSPAAAENRLERWIRWNCWLSMWAAIAVFTVWATQVKFAGSARYPTPLSGRILAGALGFVAVETLLWLFVVRKGGIEARWAAGLMSMYFVACLVIISAWASLGTATEAWIVGFFVYSAASHVAYGIFGSR